MKAFIRQIPNILTGSRVVLALALLFIPHAPDLTLPFYIVYGICGFTDMIDGTIARALGVQSKMGSRLDTLGDAAMVTVMIYILVPIIKPSPVILVWTLAILAIKFTAWVAGGMRQHDYAPPHTIMDKVVGFLLFAYPFLRLLTKSMIPIYILCAAATVAAVEKWCRLDTRPRMAKRREKSEE